MKPVIVIIMLLLCQSGFAQQPVTLSQMIKMATERNLTLQSERKGTEYWQQLQKGVFDPAKTQIGGEYGHINSLHNDTRFSINQSFNLPIVYRRQKELYQAREQAQRQVLNWKEADIQREVKLSFYQLIDMMEKRKMLTRLDSVYKRFQQSAAVRLQAGESNMLEKTTADAQLQQMKLQLQQLDDDMRIIQLRLQWLLNTGDWLLPDYTSHKKPLEGTVLDTTLVEGHPRVRYFALQEEIVTAQSKVEKSSLTPEVGFGYSNMSITGYQTKDGINQQYFDGGDRFSSFNISLAIPIFNKAVKARVRASRVNEQLSQIQTREAENQVRSTMQQASESLKKYQRSLEYYEHGGLQQAEMMISHAKLAFENGEIGYLEWTLLMNNAVNIQLGYIAVVSEYNKTLIELEYLTSK